MIDCRPAIQHPCHAALASNDDGKLQAFGMERYTGFRRRLGVTFMSILRVESQL